jgi:hypothetical protein
MWNWVQLSTVCLKTVQRKVIVDTNRKQQKFIYPAQKIYLFRQTVLPDTTRRSVMQCVYTANCCTLFRRTWDFQGFICQHNILILTVKRSDRDVVKRGTTFTTCTYTQTRTSCYTTTTATGKHLLMISHMSSPDALLGTDKAEPIKPNFLLHSFTVVYSVLYNTDGWTDGHIDRYIDRQTDRYALRQTQSVWKTVRHIDIQTDGHTEYQKYRHTKI